MLLPAHEDVASLSCVELGVALLPYLPDVVSSCNPLPGPEELDRDLGVVQPPQATDAGILEGVVPVVAVHENDGAIRHRARPRKEKPRRVALVDQTPGGSEPSPREAPESIVSL